MKVNDEVVAITEVREAVGPGWCALNSTHIVSTGDRIGFAVAAGTPLGWVCTEDLVKAQG